MKTLHIIGERPSSIPADCLILNAPRPLYESEGLPFWQGDFRHGVFYVACKPDDERTLKLNDDLDAWIIQYHTKDDVLEWAKEFLEKSGKSVSDFEFSELAQSFLLRKNRSEFENRS